MAGPSHLFQQNYKHLAYRQFAWQCKLRSSWKVGSTDKAMKFSTKLIYKTPLPSIYETYIKSLTYFIDHDERGFPEFNQMRN
jgi:hypothetical protein